MLSDTAASISRAGVRPAPNQNYAYLKNLNTNLYEAEVVRVGPAESYECTLVVRIFGANDTVKVRAAVYEGASQYGLGTYTPYLLGDHVLIQYLGGNINLPIVVARINKSQGLSDEVITRDPKIVDGGIVGPRPYTFNSEGRPLHPNPGSYIKDAAPYGAMATVTVRGILT